MKTKANKKKRITILSITLAVVLAIGGTLAYLATTTEEASNVFTFGENIRAKLTEPNWDPDEGKNLIPGYEVKKDPMITNLSSNGVDEYAALKITFTDNKTTAGTKLTDANTLKLLNMLDITWNTTDWSLESGTLTTNASGVVTAATAEQIYVYKHALTPGQVTNPLFSSVTIKSDISDEDYAWLAGIIMDHTDECYTFGTHDPSKCDITYKHHVNCAIYGLTGAENTAKGGTIGTDTCDCTPAEEHTSKDPEDPCPALVGTLTGTCSHTADASAINGFQIKVQGSAVQAGVDGMIAWNSADTLANLIALFQ